MLDAYIIDRIRKERDDAERTEGRRLRLQLPVVRSPRVPQSTDGEESSPDGPVIIPFTPEIPLYEEETENAA